MVEKEARPLKAEAIVAGTITVLTECFDGAGERGAFLDPGEHGLIGMLRTLTAGEASTPVAGASVATHALHVAFSLDAFGGWIAGVRDVEYDWSQSWAKSEVTSEEWLALLDRLERQRTELEETIRTHASTDLEASWGAMGVLAHTAYHLGAVTVKIDELRARSDS